MSQADSKQALQDNKNNYASIDQEKPQNHNSTYEQSSAQLEESKQNAPSSGSVKKASVNNATIGGERKHNSSQRSNVRESRKSLNSVGAKSLAGSNVEGSLLNNYKTRQILQNDKVLLSNRIVMLRKEEDRLMKKIKGTRGKADKIMAIKKRNEEKFHNKLQQEELEKLQQEQEREKLKQDREKRRQEFERQQKMMLENK
jgi:hypothetical protein